MNHPTQPFATLRPGQTAYIPTPSEHRGADLGPMLLIVTAPKECGFPGCLAMVVNAVEIDGETDRVFHRLPHRPTSVIRSAA